LIVKSWPSENLNMFPSKPELSITIPSKTDLLKMVVELTKHVATLNQFVPADSQQIALAVDEAITNVIKHSYRSRTDKEIRLDYFTTGKGLKIRIVYSGIPPIFSTEQVNINRMIKQKKKGGLGVELMKRIMDSVEYKRENDLNLCEMVKWKTKN